MAKVSGLILDGVRTVNVEKLTSSTISQLVKDLEGRKDIEKVLKNYGVN